MVLLDAILLCSAILLLFLFVLTLEKVRLARLRAKIPLRVCVTGTRGKSTVTRLIASVLRESGRRVLAKTTGSKPVLILPDGSEREFPRSGRPSVLEQKKVLAAAARLGADALVAEMMSIRPEYLAAEGRRIFQPGILVLTNVRPDHLEEMGSGKAAIAESLAAAIGAGGVVLAPEEENDPVFEKTARARGAVLRFVPSEPLDFDGALPGRAPFAFAEDIRLAFAVAEVLGIEREVVRRGVSKAHPDFGSLAVYSAASPLSGATWRLVNLFSANEPESSSRGLAFLESRFPEFRGRRIALLALREDRGGRTKQWLEAVRAGFFARFSRLVFIGDQARAAARAVRRKAPGLDVSAIESRRPDEIMRRVWGFESGDAQVVGMGNIVGVGGALVAYWAGLGERAR
jgi:poly-gamma-glutamate synthase PgsB/CapB